MASERVDWPGLMRLGLGALRLAPRDFWAMTPTELRLALEGAGVVPVAGAGPMGRGRLAELMAAFPDAGAGAGALRAATDAVGEAGGAAQAGSQEGAG